MAFKHTEEFKEKARTLYNNGLSAGQIAKHLNSEYKIQTGKPLTRCVILGLRNRNGDSGKKRTNVPVKTRTDIKTYMTKKRIKNEPEKYWTRKCMSCQVEKTFEKPLRICRSCKSSDIFSASFTYGSSGHQV